MMSCLGVVTGLATLNSTEFYYAELSPHTSHNLHMSVNDILITGLEMYLQSQYHPL